jgi:hypothetical protein
MQWCLSVKCCWSMVGLKGGGILSLFAEVGIILHWITFSTTSVPPYHLRGTTSAINIPSRRSREMLEKSYQQTQIALYKRTLFQHETHGLADRLFPLTVIQLIHSIHEGFHGCFHAWNICSSGNIAGV